MSYLSERAAYLKGLADGMKLESKEGELLSSVIEVINEMADIVSDMEDSQNEMAVQLDQLDALES